MPERSLDVDDLRLLAAFESWTGVAAIDCVESEGRLAFVVPGDAVGRVIGKGGTRLRALRERLRREVLIVGFADDPAEFARGLFHDIEIEGVRLEERGERRVAVVAVAARDKGRAIGKGGRHAKFASELAMRHHGIEVVVE